MNLPFNGSAFLDANHTQSDPERFASEMIRLNVVRQERMKLLPTIIFAFGSAFAQHVRVNYTGVDTKEPELWVFGLDVPDKSRAGKLRTCIGGHAEGIWDVREASIDANQSCPRFRRSQKGLSCDEQAFDVDLIPRPPLIHIDVFDRKLVWKISRVGYDNVNGSELGFRFSERGENVFAVRDVGDKVRC